MLPEATFTPMCPKEHMRFGGGKGLSFGKVVKKKREKGWGVVDRDQNDQNGGNFFLTVQNGGRLFYFFPYFPHLISNNRTKADSEKDKISAFNTVYPDGHLTKCCHLTPNMKDAKIFQDNVI